MAAPYRLSGNEDCGQVSTNNFHIFPFVPKLILDPPSLITAP